jgi:hypothetical protein
VERLTARLLAGEVGVHEELLALRQRELDQRPPRIDSEDWANSSIALSWCKAGLLSLAWGEELFLSLHDRATLRVVWSRRFDGASTVGIDIAERPYVQFLEDRRLVVASFPDGSIGWFDPEDEERSGRVSVGQHIHGMSVDLGGTLWVHADGIVRSLPIGDASTP